MALSSRSRTPLLAGVLLVPALLAALLAGGPASGAKPAPIRYDALGDSYAAGFGVGPYTGGACARSQSAYAVQLDGRARVALDDFVACSGATTLTMVSGGQLGALDADTDLVTVSIGGNDIGFSTPVVACLLGSDQQCAGALALTQAKVSGQLPALLDAAYDQIHAAAPDATVLVTGYPRLFSPEYGAYLGASPAEQQALNDGADLLDSVISAAAARHGFGFVDVVKRFDGHGVNSPEAWINGLGDPGAFHPNADGYEAYTGAVTAAVHPSAFR